MQEYNVKKVQAAITFGGIPFVFDCRHEDGIEDEMSSESSSQTVGSCGQIVYNKMPDESVKVTLNLLYGTTEDKQMQIASDIWKALPKGAYLINMAVTDEHIGETVLYVDMAFSKAKNHKWALS